MADTPHARPDGPSDGPSDGPGASARPPSPITSAMPDDWPAQATDSIVRIVDNVRDKTTGPAITATRVLVYGTAIALLAGPLLVLLLVGSMRAVEHALARGFWFVPGVPNPMWLLYVLFGVLFTAIGLWFWRKAGKPAPERRY